MRILGLDPGLGTTGWGLIEAQGNRLSHVANGELKTRTAQPLPERLADLAGQLEQQLKDNPDRKLIIDAHSMGTRVSLVAVDELQKRGALLGYGLAGKGPDGPVEMIDTGLTEEEFESWAKENSWHVPQHIRWSFVPEMSLPPVSDAAKDAIRVWPASTARTGAQHQALYHGRVELRDGCFFVGEFGQPADKLAWFHAEMGLDVDDRYPGMDASVADVLLRVHKSYLKALYPLIEAGRLYMLKVMVDEVLVPFVEELVPVVDVPGGRVVIDPPRGLLASDPDAATYTPGAIL